MVCDDQRGRPELSGKCTENRGEEQMRVSVNNIVRFPVLKKSGQLRERDRVPKEAEMYIRSDDVVPVSILRIGLLGFGSTGEDCNIMSLPGLETRHLMSMEAKPSDDRGVEIGDDA